MPPPPVTDTALVTSLSRTFRRRCYLLNKAKFAMTIAILIRTTAHGGLRLFTSRTRASPVLHFGCLARCCGRRCSGRRAVRSHDISGRGKEEESQRGVGGGGWRGEGGDGT